MVMSISQQSTIQKKALFKKLRVFKKAKLQVSVLFSG